MVDTVIMHTKPYDKYQFERIGYFCVDTNKHWKKIRINKI